MRNIYFTSIVAIFLLATLKLSGQITVTHANHSPYIGYSVSRMVLDDPFDIDPGPAGSNQTWDFSGFIGEDEEETTFIDPAGTPFAAQLEGTGVNLAVTFEDEDDFESFGYFSLSSSELLLKAFGVVDEGEPLMFGVWNPSPAMLVYPFSYGDSDNSYGEMEINMEGFTIINKAWITLDADAWGTVITPDATYNNTLRIKTTSIDSTFIYIGGNLINSEGFVSVEYMWFSAEYRWAVMTISGDLEDDDFYPYEMSYIVDEVLGINEKTALSINVYPNPASSHIFIERPVSEGSIDIRLMDLKGRKVYGTTINSGQGHISVDVSHLSKGIYFLQMISNNEVAGSQKIIIAP